MFYILYMLDWVRNHKLQYYHCHDPHQWVNCRYLEIEFHPNSLQLLLPLKIYFFNLKYLFDELVLNTYRTIHIIVIGVYGFN